MGHTRVTEAFKRRGWAYEQAPPLASPRWVKRCPAGEMIASQGDPTWDADHHAVMLELGHG